MDELYRMLSREHQADLDREVAKLTLAASARRRRWWTRGVGLIALATRRPATTPVTPPVARSES